MLTRNILTSAALLVGCAGLMLAPQDSEGAWLGSKQDDRYTLTYDAGSTKAGATGNGTVVVTPKGVWHLNREFPTSLSLTPSEGVTVTKPKLKLADAKKFDEHKGLEFSFPYEAKSAGKHKIDVKLKFAICIETSCSPVTETFSLAIDVSKS